MEIRSTTKKDISCLKYFTAKRKLINKTKSNQGKKKKKKKKQDDFRGEEGLNVIYAFTGLREKLFVQLKEDKNNLKSEDLREIKNCKNKKHKQKI